MDIGGVAYRSPLESVPLPKGSAPAAGEENHSMTAPDRLAVVAHDAAAVDSFYHLRAETEPGCCQGLACFAARADDPARWASASARSGRLYCLGKCYAGPASTADSARPCVESHVREPVLLGNVLAGGIHTLAEYGSRGGMRALAQALETPAGRVVEAVAGAALRGRGGAGFPTGRKWAAVAQASGPAKHVVANADEGDPGSFSDRMLLEDDPFLLLEGMLIAAYAVGASRGYVYVRKEYPLAALRVQDALAEAYRDGLLGPDALGPGRACDIALVVGRGSYLCGEETAMLNAIEGRRPEARTRPCPVYEQGLFGQPTLVNNVETLCAVPWIVRHGADAYAALGFSRSRGTKLVSLASCFERPGLYEVEFGISLGDLVQQIGGGLRARELRAVMVGGPLAGLLPSRLLDTRFGYEEMQAVGGAVGHGGVIGFGDDSSIAAIAHQVFRFGAYESCGKCVPCHRGGPAIERMFANMLANVHLDTSSRAGASAQVDGAQAYGRIVDALEVASLCGHGRGLAEFARSLDRHFAEELAACFA
jgi:formate dehydrogenase iron-sulfur subunit